MKIGVIVTVYNVEQYIEQCLKSILQQTYTDLELVVVDDGSTDASGRLCDEIGQHDRRVTVIHQDNQGPIIARLNGLRSTNAEFITFVDGDDWIQENLYQDIVNTGYLGKADLISFGLTRYHGPEDMRRELDKVEPGIYDKEQIYNEVIQNFFWKIGICKYGIDPSVWSKIFRRDLLEKQLLSINNLHIHYGEDIAVLYPLILEANSIAIVGECYYFHRIRKNNQVPPYIADEKYFDKLFKLYDYMRSVFEQNERKDVLLKQLDYFYIFSARLGKLKYGDLAFEEQYLFPFDKVEKGSRIVLYGAGRVGQTYYKQINKLDYCTLALWVDKDHSIYENKTIHPIMDIKYTEFDYVVIAVDAVKTSAIVEKNLCNMGIAKRKIIRL